MRARLPFPLGLVLLAGWLAPAPVSSPPAAAAVEAPRPDIVVVNTDDQRFDSLGNCLPSYGAPDGPGSVPCMPNVRSLLADHGVTFRQSFVTTSMCCPSRSSLLTGDYAHTHGVLTNEKPTGGAQAFLPREASTIAVWLHDAGYRTALIGKYLNEYTGPHVPPGWDDWHAASGSASSSYTHFKLVDNGVTNWYSDTYHTTVLGQDAVSFVDSTPADQPLFLYFAPHAPHYPWQPKKGDGQTYRDMPPWRPPSFQEADVSDKPPFWQALPIRDPTFVALRDANRQNQLETLIEVDRQIGAIADALGPRISNTLFVFTSDNGLTWGEHRQFNDKSCQFEECLRVPMVVRFDPLTGGAPSVDSAHPVLNIDLAPTAAEAAGLTDTAAMEGRSFLPLLSGAPPPDWRTAVFGENFGSLEPVTQAWPPSDDVIRTFPGDPAGSPVKYVESCDRADKTLPCAVTATEFYDETADPYELCNLLSSEGCGPPPDPALVSSLAARLHAFEAAAPPSMAFHPLPPPTSLGPVEFRFGTAGLSRYRCSVDGSPLAACASPATPPGQSHGPHTLVVVGDGPKGTAAPIRWAWTISDRFPATPSFTSVPPARSLSAVAFGFTDPEPGVRFLCSLDGAPRASCSSPDALSGLALGTHRFEVFARDGSGNLSFPASYSWVVTDDTTPPTVALKSPSPDQLLGSRTVSVTWSGGDNRGRPTYRLTERVGLGGHRSTVQSGAAISYMVPSAASGTYCFQVTAIDAAGNSTTTAERCAAVPVDDRELAFSGPVDRTAPAVAFDGTVTRLSGAGAFTRLACRGRRVGVLFRKGPDLGRAAVQLDGSTRALDLYSATAKALWWSASFASIGSHTLRVAWLGTRNARSTGTDVAVDGVACIGSVPRPA